MDTDYTVRTVTDAGMLRTRYTVVDMFGHVVTLTIRNLALEHGHGDRIIRHAISRAQYRPATVP